MNLIRILFTFLKKETVIEEVRTSTVRKWTCILGCPKKGKKDI
jgi:hypothetical protein